MVRSRWVERLDPDTDHPPSMSIGIVSAVNRIWGKAIQTDAKMSPVNYGGPLVAIDGRVFGVIVPASNRAEGETAGVDGMTAGSASPSRSRTSCAVLPRFKKGKDLRRGLLGYHAAGDRRVQRPADHRLGPARFGRGRAGSRSATRSSRSTASRSRTTRRFSTCWVRSTRETRSSLKIKRGDKEQEFKNIKLHGTVTAYVNAFLGILPMRDDPELGVEVRYVFPRARPNRRHQGRRPDHEGRAPVSPRLHRSRTGPHLSPR